MWSLKQPMSAKIQREWKSEDVHAALKKTQTKQKTPKASVFEQIQNKVSMPSQQRSTKQFCLPAHFLFQFGFMHSLSTRC